MRAWLAVPLFAVLVLAGAWKFGERIWSPSSEQLVQLRNELGSRRTEAELKVALVKTSNRKTVPAFVAGAKMAEEEINKAGGIALFDGQTKFKRPLAIEVYEPPAAEASTPERVKATISLARQIAADPNVVAVMGHSFDATIAASVVYNAAGVIFLATRNTDPALTRHRDMPYVFRVCPSDNDIMFEMADLVPNMVINKIRVGDKIIKKKINVLLLYPEMKGRRPEDDPVKRLKARAFDLIGDTLVDFSVDGISYDRDSIEKVFQDDKNEDLIRGISHDPESKGKVVQKDKTEKRNRNTDKYNKYDVLLIADLSIAAMTLRDRIEEIWTNQLLGERDKQELYQPKIFDLGDLVGSDDQKTDSVSAPTENLEYDYEGMVRLILKESKQNAVVLFERDSSGATEASSDRSSAPISSRSSYGRQLIAHLQEDVPLTEDKIVALCQLSVLNVVLARSYDPTASDFSEIVAEVAKVPADYVYLVGFNRAALVLLKQLRRAGVQTLVIGSPRLEEQLRGDLVQTAATDGPDVEDDETPERLGVTYVATTFDAWSTEDHVQKFLEKYQKYLERVRGQKIENIQSEFPGTAAYGYVSVQLLKRAFEKARTAAPRLAAQAARLFVEVDGPLGINGFKGGRDLLNLPIGFQRLGFHDKEHFIPGSRTRNRIQAPANRPAAPALSRP